MLTDADCRAAQCPEDKARKRLHDGGGMYLEVSQSGAKTFYFKYYKAGKEMRLTLGRYPEVTLRAARLLRDAARLQHKSGEDPLQAKRLAKIANRYPVDDTFADVAREYHATKSPGWSATYSEKWLRQLEKDIFPWIGKLRLKDITAPLLLDALRKVEKRGVNELAHSIRQGCSQVLRYGVQTGRCDRNPAQDLHGALRPVRTKNMAAILEPSEVGKLLRGIEAYEGQPTTRYALLLSAYLFQRPGNIRAMEWTHVDLDKALWTIPSGLMKRTIYEKDNGRPHLVPLSRQAVEVLREAKRLTEGGKFVFPALHSSIKCMSENTVSQALRRMGYSGSEMTAHGFRAMARTLIVENLPGIHQDVIEAQLAHVKSGPLGSAYDRAEFMQQRRDLMQRWADYLDGLRANA